MKCMAKCSWWIEMHKLETTLAITATLQLLMPAHGTMHFEVKQYSHLPPSPSSWTNISCPLSDAFILEEPGSPPPPLQNQGSHCLRSCPLFLCFHSRHDFSCPEHILLGLSLTCSRSVRGHRRRPLRTLEWIWLQLNF